MNQEKTDDNDINYSDPEFIDTVDPVYKMDWHPELTHEQILEALQKDIYEPVGQEYEMFLRELGLEPISKEAPHPVSPIPTPAPVVPEPVLQPIPNPVPVAPEPVLQPIPNPVPVAPEPVLQPIPNPVPVAPEPALEPIPNPVPVAPEPALEPIPNPVPVAPEPAFEPIPNPVPVAPEPALEPIPNPGPVTPEPTEETIIEPTPESVTPSEETEEEYQKVVNVAKNSKQDMTRICAGVLLAASIANVIVTPPLEKVEGTNVSAQQVVRNQVQVNQQIKKTIYSFASTEDYSIGDKLYIGDNVDVSYYGNLTGKSIKISGDHTITGYCLYSLDNDDIDYEYSFYEDRNVDGVPGRTSVGDLGRQIDVSIDEFLSKLDPTKYDLEDIRFSLHFGNLGWMDFSDIITINKDQVIVDVPTMVEQIKYNASFDGFAEKGVGAVNISDDKENPIYVPIVDEQGNYYAEGTIVRGSNGEEYILTELEQVETEKESGHNYCFLSSKLAISLAPLAVATALTIASKIRNKKNKQDSEFFEFDNEEDYKQFLEDFEKAREEYREKASFGQMLKRVFGEEVHIASQLTEEQVQELYATITSSNSETYTYSPTDQIRIMEGKVFAFHEDGSSTDITSTIAHIGRDNPNGTPGLLTDEIRQDHGGGTKK